MDLRIVEIRRSLYLFEQEQREVLPEHSRDLLSLELWRLQGENLPNLPEARPKPVDRAIEPSWQFSPVQSPLPKC